MKTSIKTDNMLHPHPVGVGLGLTLGVIYVVCALLFAIWPQGTAGFFQSWFHGMTLMQKTQVEFGVGAFFMGLISIMVFFYLTGALYAFIYNKCLSHCREKKWVK